MEKQNTNIGKTGIGLQKWVDILNINETVMYHHNGECYIGIITNKTIDSLIIDNKISVTKIV